MKQKRDCEELSEYIISNQEKFYRLAYSYMQNEQDALDMVSEAVVSAYEAIGSLRNRQGLRTWFYRILVNKCLDGLRRKQREMPETEDVFANLSFEERGYDDTGKILYEAVNLLPDKVKNVIILKYYEEFTFEEIARITGLNVNTVKSRVYSGIEMLRKIPGLKGV